MRSEMWNSVWLDFLTSIYSLHQMPDMFSTLEGSNNGVVVKLLFFALLDSRPSPITTGTFETRQGEREVCGQIHICIFNSFIWDIRLINHIYNCIQIINATLTILVYN